MPNNALVVNGGNTVNGKTSDVNITTHGSDFYWAICAVMTFATLAFIGLSFTRPRPHRVFHYITAAVTLTAAIAYFTMASNLGWTPIDIEFQRSNPKVHGVNREIFYVRYIDWVITTPLLLMDLLLTAGLPWPTILFTIFVDEVMIITGLVGALVKSSYKWGYFVFGCAALFAVAWNVTWVARKHAAALGPDVSSVYLQCGVLTIFLWFLYPIAWGLSEGGNVIAPDSEAVFYGILDFLAKPCFGILLLWGHRNIDPARLGLYIRDYDEPVGNERPIGTHEKHAAGGTHNGTTAATTTATDV
ncbi:MAG: ion channel activity [Candelina mexicana]|nr:MAG: ion channel activity [Candelina mexicana]